MINNENDNLSFSLSDKQMKNLTDHQNVIENLSAMETTTKLLINAFIKNRNDAKLVIDGIHREELINQTTIFLLETQKLLWDISNTFNLTNEQSFEKENTTTVICDNEEPELKTYTLDDIIKKRVTLKQIFITNCPLLRDLTQKHLIDIASQLRQITNLDELVCKAYSKIITNEERLCCNYEGNNGQLPYPRDKRFLLDLIIKLTLDERNQTIDDHDRRRLYIECEKSISSEISNVKNRLLNINSDENMNLTSEENFVCSLFRSILPREDIKRIVLAKKDPSTKWNDNETCIYYARPSHLLSIKQKWLERYPSDDNEVQRWLQCINWAIDSFIQTTKIRSSKRKTMDTTTPTMPIDHKRTKISLTFNEKLKKIDQTKFNVIDYATKLIQLIHNENNQTLPTLEQLQLLECIIFRFYWIINQEKTWSQILDIINGVFVIKSNDYCEKLISMNKNDQIEIQRLLQITL